MEITGNIKLIQNLQSGKTKDGKEWSKRTIVVTTDEKYPQDIPIDFLGEKVYLIDSFEVGNPVTVNINIRSNEYKDKYYVNIIGWKISATIGIVNNADQNPAREKTEETKVDLPF